MQESSASGLSSLSCTGHARQTAKRSHPHKQLQMWRCVALLVLCAAWAAHSQVLPLPPRAGCLFLACCYDTRQATNRPLFFLSFFLLVEPRHGDCDHAHRGGLSKVCLSSLASLSLHASSTPTTLTLSHTLFLSRPLLPRARAACASPQSFYHSTTTNSGDSLASQMVTLFGAGTLNPGYPVLGL